MGLPINPSWQEQTARLFSTRHLELAPHGVGMGCRTRMDRR
ncbi:Uncharacterized protein APZ42_028807 [Daphnia magna]|uniref:Uncharacterized protein n=1 Tax=Daphnia magna TaxID=35525 RepID=A0A164QE48_9CRUS|nr:Uncharacterized protein APZ42_028807 [Daphnia magna]